MEHIKATYDSKFRRCLSSEFVIESQIHGEGLGVERGGEALVWCVDRGKEIVHLTVHASFNLIKPEVEVVFVEIAESPQVLVKGQPGYIIVFSEN